jgi:tetratricopeptide (TPR) repeat protein
MKKMLSCISTPKIATMKMIPLLLIAALLTGNLPTAFACGNEYYRKNMPLKAGKLDLKFLLNWSGDATPYWYHGMVNGEGMEEVNLINELEKKGVQFNKGFKLTQAGVDEALKKKIDFKLLSDYAWHIVRAGRAKEALYLLEKLYAQHPNEYNILANLGTTYELTGNNHKALELLKKAVAINPRSHYGSEWIHIAILEQKTAARPDYTKIMNLQTGPDITKWINNKQYKFSQPADSLLKQLAYQLHERIFFVKAPDAIVQQLITDFANIVAKTRSGKEAEPFYKFAATYGRKVK